jgi:RNA polymerase sigma factor (sigma-70 family)
MANHDIDALLEGHIPSLRRYAFALVRNHDAADDLVQDCLERALASRTSSQTANSPRAWLFTILRNVYLTNYRYEKRRGRPMAFDEDTMSGMPADQDKGLEARDALAALDHLSEDHKSLLLLIGVEDLSYEEAATVLGISIGTVMSRLSRARQKLRDLMETERPFVLRSVK